MRQTNRSVLRLDKAKSQEAVSGEAEKGGNSCIESAGQRVQMYTEYSNKSCRQAEGQSLDSSEKTNAKAKTWNSDGREKTSVRIRERVDGRYTHYKFLQINEVQ